MEVSKSTALVTGANRGIGRHFALQLLERGATKVYTTARNPELVDIPGVEVLQLDITDLASVAAAAAAASDVTLLINNAGISTFQNHRLLAIHRKDDHAVDRVGRLPERHRYVLGRRYSLDDRASASFAELDRELDISRERICQLQRWAEHVLKRARL